MRNPSLKIIDLCKNLYSQLDLTGANICNLQIAMEPIPADKLRVHNIKTRLVVWNSEHLKRERHQLLANSNKVCRLRLQDTMNMHCKHIPTTQVQNPGARVTSRKTRNITAPCIHITKLYLKPSDSALECTAFANCHKNNVHNTGLQIIFQMEQSSYNFANRQSGIANLICRQQTDNYLILSTMAGRLINRA